VDDHVVVPELTVRRVIVAGIGGCALLVGSGPPLPTSREASAVAVVATVTALALVRWWPFLILGGGVLSAGVALTGRHLGGPELAFVGVLAGAWSSGGGEPGAGPRRSAEA
jgi:hypothetical protein